MRIIAGTKRGMKLYSPDGYVSRPVIDRVKESLFSVLYKYDLPAGKMTADLLCGVGSLGLEALSRGAEFACFVEADDNIASVLKKNIEKAGFVEKSKVLRMNAFRSGAVVDLKQRKYELVFIDPPYALTEDVGQASDLYKLLILLQSQITPDATVIVRTKKEIELLQQYGRLKVIERRCWASMAVTILQVRNNDE